MRPMPVLTLFSTSTCQCTKSLALMLMWILCDAAHEPSEQLTFQAAHGKTDHP